MAKFWKVLFLLAISLGLSNASFFSFLFGSKVEQNSPSMTSASPKSAPADVRVKPRPPSSSLSRRPANFTRTISRPANSSVIPKKHNLEEVMTHRMKESVIRLGHLTKVVFVGDSFIFRLLRNETIWNSLETKYAAISLSTPSDTTENILHRVKFAEYIRNITSSPTVIVNVGFTNLQVGDSAEATFQGVVAVVDLLAKTFPQSKIVLLDMIPRNPRMGNRKPNNETVNAVNALIKEKFGTSKAVTLVETVKGFLNAQGELEGKYFGGDTSSLSVTGFNALYQLIAAQIAGVKPLDRPLPRPVAHIHAHTNSSLPGRMRFTFNSTALRPVVGGSSSSSSLRGAVAAPKANGTATATATTAKSALAKTNTTA